MVLNYQNTLSYLYVHPPAQHHLNPDEYGAAHYSKVIKIGCLSFAIVQGFALCVRFVKLLFLLQLVLVAQFMKEFDFSCLNSNYYKTKQLSALMIVFQICALYLTVIYFSIMCQDQGMTLSGTRPSVSA